MVHEVFSLANYSLRKERKSNFREINNQRSFSKKKKRMFTVTKLEIFC